MGRWHQLSYFGILVTVLLLIGCAPQPQVTAAVTPESTRATLQQTLENNGVQVIRVGETVTLVLSSDIFFNTDSANLSPAAAAMLDVVADYLNQFSIVKVAVSGYTDDAGALKRDEALSTRQAEVVSDYLSSQGVDPRLLVAVGYGQEHTVASNLTAVGRSLNRRIEISFRYLPPLQVL